MYKKVVVLGGGTGMSTLLRGLKQFPLDITSVVSVCDDGKSTGFLRKEFNIPAVGDLRKVMAALSLKEPIVEELINYRFDKGIGLKGHTVGNILLTAAYNMRGNMSGAVETLGNVLNLKGKVLPLTEDSINLMAEMENGNIISGEHNITEAKMKIKRVYYEKEPIINSDVIREINEANLIILSMGSIYTSIIPNLICNDIIKAIDNNPNKIMYVCNLFTQPGETDNFKVSDHVKIINKYLGNKKIEVVVCNSSIIDKKISDRYATLEQKDPVILDKNNKELEKVKIIEDNMLIMEQEYLRHDSMRLAFNIFSYLMR